MGLRIREMRKRAGMTQGELADATGVNIGTIGNWEREITTPDVEQIWNCCVALGCTPNDILGWDEEDTETDTPMTEDEREVVANYRQSSTAWRKNIAQTARLAAGQPKAD